MITKRASHTVEAVKIAQHMRASGTRIGLLR